MQWEQLTSPEFAKAVKEVGVCVVAFGVVERHSDHLPLGTDFLNGHKLACLAAEKEPAIVFPPFYFGQIYEARCFPGTVSLKPTLLIEVIQGVLDEIGRNGFKKIILLSAHGGNAHLLPFLAQASLAEQKPYTLYLFQPPRDEAYYKVWNETVETDEHGHACECETSISLANHPELVHVDQVPAKPGSALKMLYKHGMHFWIVHPIFIFRRKKSWGESGEENNFSSAHNPSKIMAKEINASAILVIAKNRTGADNPQNKVESAWY